MKRIITVAAACAAFATFAALDLFTGVKGVAVQSGVMVTSGASNVVQIAKGPMRGIGAVYVSDGGAEGRTALTVSLIATNTVSGGWTLYAEDRFTATNAAVRSVRFAADYLPTDIKVSVKSEGAATKVSSIILTY